MADVTELHPGTPDSETDLVTYAFVLTMQIGMPGGVGFAYTENSGTWTARRGTSRNEVFLQIREEIMADARQKGLGGPAQVIFWSLERDTLL